MARQVTIYQVYDLMDTYDTEEFFATKKEANLYAAWLKSRTEYAEPHINECKITMTKIGICVALSLIPHR